MQLELPDTRQYFSYYHLTLCLGDMERYMGRVNHFQVNEIEGEIDIHTHSVRFYDGMNHRELQGKVRAGNDSALILDMGQGKSYRFKKLEL